MIALLIAAGLVAHAPLQPWTPLIGHCFEGPAPGGRGTDRHCFESVYAGQHIRDTHVVTVEGRAVYSGETLYSAVGERVLFTYWNSLGGFGMGEAKIRGNDWSFSGTIHGTPRSADEPMETAWKITSEGYEVIDPATDPRLFRRVD